MRGAMLDFTASLLEVWCGDRLVSRHRLEREALESIQRDALGGPAAVYEIRQPAIRVRYTPDAAPPSPPGGWYPRPGSINGAASLG